MSDLDPPVGRQYKSADILVEVCRETLENNRNEDDLTDDIREEIGFLIFANKELDFIINSISERGGETDKYESHLEDICTQTHQLISSFNTSRKAILLKRLSGLVEEYPERVYYAFGLDPVGVETTNELSTRDQIEALLTELDPNSVPCSTKSKIDALDEVLKIKYQHLSDICRADIERIAKTHLPEKYWWRHPEKFVQIE